MQVPLVSALGNPDIPDATVPIRKAVVSGFFANAAFLQPDGSYKTAKSHQVRTATWLQDPPTTLLTSRRYRRYACLLPADSAHSSVVDALQHHTGLGGVLGGRFHHQELHARRDRHRTHRTYYHFLVLFHHHRFSAVVAHTHIPSCAQWLAELASHFYDWKGKPMPKT
jgi:hypothetical protein